jgi:acyl carrier protein
MSDQPMNEATILAGITAAARRELRYTGELRPEQRLVEDLQLDSIRLLSLSMAVEDHFRIALDADDEGGIEKIGDLIALVARKLEQQLAAGLAAPRLAGEAEG